MGLLDKFKRSKGGGTLQAVIVEKQYAKLEESLSEIRTDAKCPHCGVLLDSVPARKKKCPSCGQFIYVRTHPSTRIQVVLTEEEAKSIDALRRLGVDEEEYRDNEKELLKRFKIAPSQ